MTEQVDVKPEGAGATTETPEGVQVGIQRIYTKDVSFEAPNVPEVFQDANFKPEVKMEMNSKSRKITDDMYEVVLTMTITAASGETTGFLVEVQQAGLFGVRGLNDAQLRHLLSTFCPETLYPYAREVISSLVSKGGFPPVYLAPVNFDALFRAQMEQQAQQQNAAPEGQPAAE
ncbi:protein-export chaperone SecB [Pleionea mediterranea]|jgi:preprotein translocase subunit SecB|uniref:Protein-export protein SecB n=1 Tax=Pleionea mediterranea TaxID=523701 RepID=A0A316FZ98_9GAMM|nr:protein-export chaperone SecB [Pleionea mediterranea]PWK53026.1 protein translocase subunit secB [Pleionea mediterranea]